MLSCPTARPVRAIYVNSGVRARRTRPHSCRNRRTDPYLRQGNGHQDDLVVVLRLGAFSSHTTSSMDLSASASERVVASSAFKTSCRWPAVRT